MKVITVTSLAGGQGKSTLVYFLSQFLAKSDRVLVVDGDPQSSVTSLFGIELKGDQSSLYEVITGDCKTMDAVYRIKDNLSLIPSDRILAKANTYLANTGSANIVLQKRLKNVEGFDCILIDTPPQNNQIAISAICAADHLLIPIELRKKGVASLLNTLELVDLLKDEWEVLKGDILGIVPFRDKWIGRNRSQEGSLSLEQIKVYDYPIFDSIRESEKIVKFFSSPINFSEISNCFAEISQLLKLSSID
jgi:chromosome partitioning protein